MFLESTAEQGGSPSDSAVKKPPALQEMQEMLVQFLCWKIQEKGVATHSSILAWEITWTQESGRLQSIASQRIGHNWSDWAHTHAEQGGLVFTIIQD